MPYLTLASFEDDSRAASWRTIATITPRLRCVIMVDQVAQDPTDNDMLWPMIVRGLDDRRTTVKVDSQLIPFSLQRPVYAFTHEQLVHDQHSILAAYMGTPLPLTERTMPGVMQAVRQHCADNDWPERAALTDPGQIIDMVEAWDSDPIESIDKLHALWNLAAIAEQDSASGYNQGDHIDMVCLATPAVVEQIMGAGADEAAVRRSMKAQMREYGDWAFGNVHGFRFEALPADIDPDDASETDWAELDGVEHSCWGFIGDIDASGILDQINEVMRYAEVQKYLSDNLTQEIAA